MSAYEKYHAIKMLALLAGLMFIAWKTKPTNKGGYDDTNHQRW